MREKRREIPEYDPNGSERKIDVRWQGDRPITIFPIHEFQFPHQKLADNHPLTFPRRAYYHRSAQLRLQGKQYSPAHPRDESWIGLPVLTWRQLTVDSWQLTVDRGSVAIFKNWYDSKFDRYNWGNFGLKSKSKIPMTLVIMPKKSIISHLAPVEIYYLFA